MPPLNRMCTLPTLNMTVGSIKIEIPRLTALNGEHCDKGRQEVDNVQSQCTIDTSTRFKEIFQDWGKMGEEGQWHTMVSEKDLGNHREVCQYNAKNNQCLTVGCVEHNAEKRNGQ